MKFIADSMLGRLAKWLRMLGYDTLYYPRIEDRLLLRIAREDDRILLTRDTRLVKARGLRKFLLLTANDPFDQLRSVVRTLNLQYYKSGGSTSMLSRCSICNCTISDIPKEKAKEHVPEYVYLSSDRFKYCTGCDKFYWDGTHPGKLRVKLSEVLEDIP
jgi:uncharacterized protein with PIN domain